MIVATPSDTRRRALDRAIERNLGASSAPSDRASGVALRRPLIFATLVTLGAVLLSAGAARLARLPPAHEDVRLLEAPVALHAETPESGLTASGVPRAWPRAIRTVVIDAGHGGVSSGTALPGVKEKDLVLDIGLRLRDLLTEAGFGVVMTREDDRDLSLEERTELANRLGGDALVSIHVNWMGRRSIRGIETFYLGSHAGSQGTESHSPTLTGDSAIRPLGPALGEQQQTDSRRLAQSVQDELVRFLTTLDPEINDRGVKTAPLVVLAQAQMPAVLAEVSCLSNHKDATLLQRGSYRQYIADALAQGIQGFADQHSTGAEAGR